MTQACTKADVDLMMSENRGHKVFINSLEDGMTIFRNSNRLTFDDWLDANSYAYRNKLTSRLQEQNIEFTQTQHFKTFMFRFKQEDSTMFVMRWS